MNRNILDVGIGTLAVVALVLGYQVHEDRQKADGVSIEIGKSGISIEPE